MKPFFLLLTITVIYSCQNPSTSSSEKVDSFSVTSEPEISKLSEAKNIAKTIFEYVEQADTKKITKKQLDKKAMPFQKKLDSLRIELSPSEIKELDAYRAKLVNEMVDRKVSRDN